MNESSGRHLATRHVARRFGCTPANVRAMVKAGTLVPSHVIPPDLPGGQPMYIFHADYIEERARARELRAVGRVQLDQALGFAPLAAELPAVQRELPLREGIER